jgi:hypothetical protein
MVIEGIKPRLIARIGPEQKMQRVQLVICVGGLRGERINDKTVGWDTIKIQYCSPENYNAPLGLHHQVGSATPTEQESAERNLSGLLGVQPWWVKRRD